MHYIDCRRKEYFIIDENSSILMGTGTMLKHFRDFNHISFEFGHWKVVYILGAEPFSNSKKIFEQLLLLMLNTSGGKRHIFHEIILLRLVHYGPFTPAIFSTIAWTLTFRLTNGCHCTIRAHSHLRFCQLLREP